MYLCDPFPFQQLTKKNQQTDRQTELRRAEHEQWAKAKGDRWVESQDNYGMKGRAHTRVSNCEKEVGPTV